MVGWHPRLNGHEFEQAPGVGDGQGSLACCSPWGRKESDTTERLNGTERAPARCRLHTADTALSGCNAACESSPVYHTCASRRFAHGGPEMRVRQGLLPVRRTRLSDGSMFSQEWRIAHFVTAEAAGRRMLSLF